MVYYQYVLKCYAANAYISPNRLKSFYEGGEREMMNEHIMVLQNKVGRDNLVIFHLKFSVNLPHIHIYLLYKVFSDSSSMFIVFSSHVCAVVRSTRLEIYARTRYGNGSGFWSFYFTTFFLVSTRSCELLS